MRTEVSSVAELPEMHLMGHTCTNLNGDLMFVWGGTNDDVAYSTAPNTDLWIYETLTGYWRHRKCSGDCPPYLSSCASAIIGQKMYIFGGHSTTQDNWLNCLYCLDLDNFVWRDLGAKARAEPTKPIRSDKNVAWAYANKMYIFGGYGWSQVEHFLELTDRQADLQLVPDFRWPKFGWNNQLVEYDPSDKTWRWPSYRGKCPSARAAHSGALMGDKYFVFGGRDSHERLNDLYTFDMKTLEWQQIAVFTSDLNEPRRPIGHLLDALESSQRVNQPEDINENYVEIEEVEDDDPATEEENHRQLVEEMHDVVMEDDDWADSHPSSSFSSLEPSINISAGSTRPAQADDDDNDDDFEYPHPSHLLERWSLSSRNPPHLVDSDQQNLNMNSDTLNENSSGDIDCLYQAHHQQQQEQEQNFMAVTERSPDAAFAANSANQQVSQAEEARVLGDNDLGQQHLAQNSQDQQQLAASHQDQSGPPTPLADQPVANGTVTRPQPAGRSFCSLTPISNENMLLFGGVDSHDKNLDDCWVFNIATNQWTQITDYKHKRPRLWHTGAKTKQNEVVIMGGSSSEKIDEYCSDVFVMSFEPKSLKRLSLDTVSRSVRMKTIQQAKWLPSTLVKLIKLRKQAMALTMRRSASQRLLSNNI